MIERSIHQAQADSAREALEAGIGAQVIFDGDPPGSLRLDLDMAMAQSVAASFLNQSSATFRLPKPQIATVHMPCPATWLGASFQASMGGALRAEIRMERPVCPGFDEPAF